MLEVAENVVYAGNALFLVLAALVLLVFAGRTEREPDEGEGGEQGAAPGRAAEARG